MVILPLCTGLESMGLILQAPKWSDCHFGDWAIHAAGVTFSLCSHLQAVLLSAQQTTGLPGQAS